MVLASTTYTMDGNMYNGWKHVQALLVPSIMMTTNPTLTFSTHATTVMLSQIYGRESHERHYYECIHLQLPSYYALTK